MSQPLGGKCSANFSMGKDATPVITGKLDEIILGDRYGTYKV